MNFIEKLNKSLKFGSGRPARASFIHDNESAILSAATQLLNKSVLGAELLTFAQESGLTLHVLRNKQDFGFLPGESTVYISCPAGQDMPTARAVIHLAGALRQAQQETTEGLKRPKTALIAKERYVNAYVAKDRDMRIAQAAVVYELSQVNGLLEIVDEFSRMGYGSLYEAYKEDVKSQLG